MRSDKNKLANNQMLMIIWFAIESDPIGLQLLTSNKKVADDGRRQLQLREGL
jgi:hypothetical protein